MSRPESARPAKPGELVLFTAAAAPTLDETGMMDAMAFEDPAADAAPITPEEIARFKGAGKLTVPFRQEGPGGFSLVVIEFAPGYLLPRHSHSCDCLYYIVEGSIVMGRRELGAGDGFFLPAEQVYAYHAGPKGVKLLEFRHSTAFDMRVYEKDMVRYRAKAFESMATRGAVAERSAQ